MNKLLTVFVRFYQWLRVALLDPLAIVVFGYASQCRYQESCSTYALRILRTHATIPALHLIWQRVSSCHGWRKKWYG